MSGPCLRVLATGPGASLQDGGRVGFQRYGLSASGPMDRLAHAAGNALVGNEPNTGAIEFAMSGGRFQADGGSVRLALAGAPCRLSCDGEPIAHHASFLLREGGTLRIERPRDGVFAYLAVAGGVAVDAVMGSLSLHARAALGGMDGRPIDDGMRLPLRAAAPAAASERMLDPIPLERAAPIRVVLGPQADAFTEAGIATLLGQAFAVSNRADRMGYQLEGPAIAHGAAGFNIVSDGTVAGSIQVPGSGQPIVLLADRQTTGGYPKIATVVSADLRRIAQRRPGEVVRFSAVSLEDAVHLARARAALVASLPQALRPVAGALDRLLAANLAGEAVDALEEPS